MKARQCLLCEWPVNVCCFKNVSNNVNTAMSTLCVSVCARVYMYMSMCV